MNIKIEESEQSIADQLLKQLQDQYNSVLAQNMIMPKQNVEPEDDPDNPYQQLDFQDQEECQDQYDNQEQKSEQQRQTKRVEDSNQNQLGPQNMNINIGNLKINENQQSNPEIKQQLMQVLPTSQEIYTNLPHKQFQIDQDKIKTFALEMDIKQPAWLNSQDLCKKRIQQLFNKQKNIKPFTKI